MRGMEHTHDGDGVQVTVHLKLPGLSLLSDFAIERIALLLDETANHWQLVYSVHVLQIPPIRTCSRAPALRKRG
jgi:hypothetical protein